jgi:hypothetical protein
MKRSLLVIASVALYLLHQDFWFWRAATPIVFGFLPVGLFYHVCYTLVISALMWALVKYAWPSHLETERWRDGETEGQRDRGTERRRGEELNYLSVPPSLRPSVPPSPSLSVYDSQEGRDT